MARITIDYFKSKEGPELSVNGLSPQDAQVLKAIIHYGLKDLGIQSLLKNQFGNGEAVPSVVLSRLESLHFALSENIFTHNECIIQGKKNDFQ